MITTMPTTTHETPNNPTRVAAFALADLEKVAGAHDVNARFTSYEPEIKKHVDTLASAVQGTGRELATAELAQRCVAAASSLHEAGWIQSYVTTLVTKLVRSNPDLAHDPSVVTFSARSDFKHTFNGYACRELRATIEDVKRDEAVRRISPEVAREVAEKLFAPTGWSETVTIPEGQTRQPREVQLEVFLYSRTEAHSSSLEAVFGRADHLPVPSSRDVYSVTVHAGRFIRCQGETLTDERIGRLVRAHATEPNEPVQDLLIQTAIHQPARLRESGAAQALLQQFLEREQPPEDGGKDIFLIKTVVEHNDVSPDTLERLNARRLEKYVGSGYDKAEYEFSRP